MLIGDVRGNGLAAVDDATAVIGAFCEAAHRDVKLEHVALSLDASVRRRVDQVGQTDSNAAERFITALVLEIPDDLYVVHVRTRCSCTPTASSRPATRRASSTRRWTVSRSSPRTSRTT
ncbi:hypothetical protein [Streptomyces sp. NPDC005181]|uniref:hypothetical protein n=1 Tax=Streptomyces sp. NPDC005181 TaxID=3156869 RepID=UPI0033A61569